MISHVPCDFAYNALVSSDIVFLWAGCLQIAIYWGVPPPLGNCKGGALIDGNAWYYFVLSCIGVTSSFSFLVYCLNGIVMIQEEEKRRNSLGLDILFIHKSHPLSMKIFSFWKRNKDKDNPKLSKAKVKRKIDPEVRCVTVLAKDLSSCTFLCSCFVNFWWLLVLSSTCVYGGLRSSFHTQTQKQNLLRKYYPTLLGYEMVDHLKYCRDLST